MRLGDWQDTSDLRPANMAEINIIRLMFDISLYHGMDNKGKKKTLQAGSSRKHQGQKCAPIVLCSHQLLFSF